MSVNRKLFKVPFSKNNPSQWMCPTCDKGVLEGKKGSFSFEETKGSLKAHGIIDWEPCWITYVYSCQFVCTNPVCKETVFNVGKGTVDSYYTDEDEEQFYENFTPEFFIPHLNIFKISENTPEDIKESINKSFELFFVNPSASANHLRIALEQLLDSFKVKKFVNRRGKRFQLSLHKRIELVPDKVSDFKDSFLAIKWLGNDGSHVKGILIDDVMDAYDILSPILDEVFGEKTKRTRSLVNKINKGR